MLLAAAIVLVALGVANYVGWLRLKPEVSAIAWIADKPDYESHLVNIHQRALARTQPGATDAYLPIYDIQNPGLFLLVVIGVIGLFALRMIKPKFGWGPAQAEEGEAATQIGSGQSPRERMRTGRGYGPA